MSTEYQTDPRNHSMLIRIGGVAVLVGLVIHIVANVFLKEFPPADPSLAELRTYLAAEAEAWKIVHGMRYLAVACLALFLAAIFVRTHFAANAGGWEYVGLIGGILQLSNLFITNGIETFAFLDFGLQGERPELFWSVFHTTRVLFTAEIVAWSILIFGFSIAGWRSGKVPKAVATLGYVASALGLVSGVFIGTVMTTGGWPAMTLEIAALSSLLWFLCIGVQMSIRGAS